MEAKNNVKSLIWLLVLNGKKESTTEEIVNSLKGVFPLLLNCSSFKFVSAIIHDRDAEKRPHLHAFIELPDKYTKKAVLELLTELLRVEPEQVSLEPSNSPILGIQYLTHKNQPEKESYDFEEIQTNDFVELTRRYDDAYVSPEQALKTALYGSKTLAELMDKIGIAEVKKYLPVFKAIQEETSYDKRGLIDQLNKMRRDYQTLYDLTNEIFEVLRYKVLKGRENDFILYFGRLLAIFETLLPF